ncbi:MAG: guanylate kinase [Verrucomicrobiae bacterium]|nr:guanylate kinase [Verrucomicrobiae bacterium]
MNHFKRRGILFVVSAPSGAGKSTICANLKQTPDFQYSVSCTTRPARSGEENGLDYWFLSQEEFEQRKSDGAFLETAWVHGHQYGTLKVNTEKAVREGTDLLLDIDVTGARQIRESLEPWIQEALVDIFIMPPTLEELERRLRKRGTETEEQISYRLNAAKEEIGFWQEYHYTILSETMEEDLQKFRSIIRAERYKSKRLILC